MKKTAPNQIIFTVNANGDGRVTAKMVRERAEAMAVMKGRDARDVTEGDLTHARQVLSHKPRTLS